MRSGTETAALPRAARGGWKRQLRPLGWPLLLLAVGGYFFWHTVYGNRGLIAWEARLNELAVARQERAAAVAERDAWERRVAGLKGERLDADLIDERARDRLSLVGKDDVVIPYPRERPLF